MDSFLDAGIGQSTASGSVAHRPLEDLTARARIREAALRLFAERGIAAATIRDIARAAGVSSGLVRHHFGSKEALRDACDAYAIDQMNRLRDQMFAEGRLADQAFMGSVHPTAMLLRNYLVRSMMDGSTTAASMFESMVEIGERFLAGQKIESTDLRAYSAVLCAMQMGVFLMQDQLSQVLGVDVRTPEGIARATKGFADVFSHPLLSPEQAAQLYAAADQIKDHITHSG
ncbi:MAG TPA: TetR family transcriptional regulator [Micromonosporaceae bacterium]|nr:TetR family transcriptional regulator [Micromonosporaceae bacterium]